VANHKGVTERADPSHTQRSPAFVDVNARKTNREKKAEGRRPALPGEDHGVTKRQNTSELYKWGKKGLKLGRRGGLSMG